MQLRVQRDLGPRTCAPGRRARSARATVVSTTSIAEPTRMAARWPPLKSLYCFLVAMIITLLRTPLRYLSSPSEVAYEPSHRATKQIHMTRTGVGPCVVAEAVVDHPCGSALARPCEGV